MNLLKGLRICLLLLIGLFVAPGISFASGYVSASISSGPQNYIENISSFYLDVFDYLTIGTEATFFDKKDSDFSQIYLLEAIISPNKAIEFDVGLTFSPQSNNMKSNSFFGGINYIIYRSDANAEGKAGYSTTVGVAGEVKDTYRKVASEWRKLDQNSISLSLKQTFLTDYFFRLGYTIYSYGYETIGAEIIGRRFITGLPSNMFSATLGAYLLNRLTLDLTYSTTAFKLNQPRESSYAIGLDYALLQNIGINLGYTLYSYTDKKDSYYTGGITYYFK